MSKLEIASEKELLKKLEQLGVTDEEQKKEITCSLVGHSLIQSTFFGYYYCGRCGAQAGDTLACIRRREEVRP